MLFLCIANSARSQMAEGLAKNLFDISDDIFSAGSAPTKLNPYAVAALAEIGIDIRRQYSKDLNIFINKNIDLVITLCAEQACPVFPERVRHLHWPLEDPDCKNEKLSDAEFTLRFRKTRESIIGHLTELKKSL